MKLILYFGQTGTAKKAAELLKEHFSDSIVMDGTKRLCKDFSNIDTIILGSNIHMGKLHKTFSKVVKKLQKKKLNVKYHAYIVSANAGEKGKYMTLAKKLLPEDSYIGYFGGELDPSKAKGLNRLVIQDCINKLVDQNLSLPSLNLEAIADFVEHVRAL